MPDPVRLLHFADLHIGVETYGRTDPETGLSTRVRDFLRRLDDLVEQARDRDADLIIFAGDAFQSRNPNPTYQREFAYRVLDLSQIAPVVLLVGNHDLPPAVLKASSVEIYETLRVPNIWVAGDYEGRVVETKRGPVYVAAAPYPIRARLMEDERAQGKTVREIDEAMQLTLARIIDNLATEADTHDVPRVLTGHFTISGSLLGSERQIMLGRDIDVQLADVADDRWDYVAMGHVHKHQNLTKGREDSPPVVYAGSIERIDFGEEGDPKGYCWVELSRGKTDWEFVQNNARRFLTLRLDLRRSDDPTAETLSLIERAPLFDTVARLFVQLTPEREAAFNENLVRDAIRRAGVFHLAGIRKEVESPERARLGSSPEGLTHAELLERYLLAREIPPARREELLAEAERIFNPEG